MVRDGAADAVTSDEAFGTDSVDGAALERMDDVVDAVVFTDRSRLNGDGDFSKTEDVAYASEEAFAESMKADEYLLSLVSFFLISSKSVSFVPLESGVVMFVTFVIRLAVWFDAGFFLQSINVRPCP